MSSLNKIFEKMGLYDLFVLLFTGIMIVSVTIFLNQQIFDWQVLYQLEVDETASFLLVSYLTGLCFHEASSLLVRVCIAKDDDGMLRKMLEAKRKWQPSIPELDIKPKTKEKNESSSVPDAKPVAFYHVCKAWYAKNGDSVRNERDQYTAGISRSLSLYFLVITICIVWKTFHLKECVNWAYAITSGILAVIFFFRYERFTYMRYARIIRAYLYNADH